MLPDLMNPGDAIKKLMAPIMEDGPVDDAGIQSLVKIGMDGLKTLADLMEQSEATKPVRTMPCPTEVACPECQCLGSLGLRAACLRHERSRIIHRDDVDTSAQAHRQQAYRPLQEALQAFKTFDGAVSQPFPTAGPYTTCQQAA